MFGSDKLTQSISRSCCCQVEAQDLLGELHRDTFRGEAARAFQHELDHLNGVLIIDHATDDGDFTSKAYPKLRALEEAEHAKRQDIAFGRAIDVEKGAPALIS